ncbi:hypothetical protein CDAR_54941 [Caerostris darwini]|uniref:Uncharacterized protein n=1 Tax=Caerostris darwini TaxID=1538125 RepID=A0AAV4PB64_9ARAC|nr:hypothetical protein CDAR_54941 [Caerostris darwini]
MTTKRFQTDTLGSDLLPRRANIYDIVCKSLQRKIMRSNSLQAIPSSIPLSTPGPTPHKTSSSLSQFSYQHHSNLYVSGQKRNCFFVPHYGHFSHFGYIHLKWSINLDWKMMFSSNGIYAPEPRFFLRALPD